MLRGHQNTQNIQGTKTTVNLLTSHIQMVKLLILWLCCHTSKELDINEVDQMPFIKCIKNKNACDIWQVTRKGQVFHAKQTVIKKSYARL